MPATSRIKPEGDAVPAAMSRRYQELERKLLDQRPDQDPELLRRAFAFAAERHRGQKRKSGDPYLAHSLEVAHMLADMRLDQAALASGLLHDIVEDTPVTVPQLRSSRISASKSMICSSSGAICSMGMLSSSESSIPWLFAVDPAGA